MISYKQKYKLEDVEEEFNELLLRFSRDDQELIHAAKTFATKSHGEQKRDNGVPYVIHPIRTASILIRDMGVLDADMIIGMLLHDVVEDTPVMLGEVEKKFGNRVSIFVKGLTRERPLNESEEHKKKSKQEKIDWFLSSGSKELKTMKCSDLLDNMRSWINIPEDHPSVNKFARWMREVETQHIPLGKVTDPFFERNMVEVLEEYKKIARFNQ
ncbi:MAG: HD domain-containing protein [Candidatus Magasanikbacteria bacterium]|jgi:(p)ppGpp synthase/HD superfamily hydrolase|nr:HD domain-containing protein [Candidatus Magasanikbacteria bacterium]MBT4221094.1 HD domain-containing protein [Candidatus Magasanikbacteria bacterium]MBT4350562.1 HD domain-containing protein [Candidatus Magasanikbacteria bacterium]MBT4542139.1 HD domain-containing protein [Candidatus Magasanikbacteria bacterium]MBT6253261.1 HD domain-containing protein [Candidatus Magasanikbacteria bacterium]